eukprot:1193720-Prorocentrum_minimum.AAC.4
MKPLFSHSTTEEFNSPPKSLWTPKKCQSWELPFKPLLSHSTTGEWTILLPNICGHRVSVSTPTVHSLGCCCSSSFIVAHRSSSNKRRVPP